MKFNLVTIRPQGFAHSNGFRELQESVGWALAALGHESNIAENAFSSEGYNIVFGAELISPDSQLPSNAIIFNIEQDSHPAFNSVLKLGASAMGVWEYSAANLPRWAEHGVNAVHVPFGFTPNMVRIPKAATQDIDVLFTGFITARRAQIINDLKGAGLNVAALDNCYAGSRDQYISRSKVCLNLNHDGRNQTNIQRMSFWAANSKCIVSEFSSDLKDYNYLIDFVQFYAYGDLVSGCKHFVNIAEHRENVEEKTLKLFSKHDFVTTVAAALEHLPARNPILERYEKGCREGDMKEYLPWLRKNSRGRMLEIGVRDGASTSAMLLGLEENGGHLHSIDQNDCSKLWTHPRWTFEHNDSKKAIFPDNEFDAALIDGDHTKTGFLADLNNCYRWVKHGGIIMCHDIEAKQTSETCGGDFPSREVGEEYRKFVMGLTHFELPGEFGFGVMVVEK